MEIYLSANRVECAALNVVDFRSDGSDQCCDGNDDCLYPRALSLRWQVAAQRHRRFAACDPNSSYRCDVGRVIWSAKCDRRLVSKSTRMENHLCAAWNYSRVVICQLPLCGARGSTRARKFESRIRRSRRNSWGDR